MRMGELQSGRVAKTVTATAMRLDRSDHVAMMHSCRRSMGAEVVGPLTRHVGCRGRLVRDSSRHVSAFEPGREGGAAGQRVGEAVEAQTSPSGGAAAAAIPLAPQLTAVGWDAAQLARGGDLPTLIQVREMTPTQAVDE